MAADDCWNTPRKMMSQYVLYSEVCIILAKETNDSFINLVVTDRGNCIPIRIASTRIRNTKVESSCLFHKYNVSTVDHEVSSTARALLSALPGLRPGFQEMLR